MKVSIVTPTLNAATYLERNLKSIWSSPPTRVSALEQIVVDGGSSDGTLEIAAKYPCTIVSGSDSGMYDAINKGLARVEGGIATYVNADDEVTPGTLDFLVVCFSDPNVNWVVGATRVIDAEGRNLATLRPPRWISPRRYVTLGWNCFSQPSTWFRAGFLEALGRFDTTFQLAADYDFFARALKVERPLFVNRPLSRFRLHDENLSKAHDAIRAESLRVAERHGAVSADDPALRALSIWATRLEILARNPRWYAKKQVGLIKY